MRTILLLAISIFSAVAFAGTSEEWLADTDRGYRETLLKCPERIWPGMDWSQTQFVAVDTEKHQAWLIGANTNGPELLPANEVPEVVFQATFSFLKVRGISSVSVIMDNEMVEGGTSVFNLAVHEMFHHQGQKGWKTGGGTRGTLVPIDPMPRYIRAELMASLKKALKESVGLDKAANWYQAWSEKYPHEFASSTDGYEGTAYYVETVAAIFHKKGCGISDEELKTELRAFSDQFVNTIGSELDSEGYSMGAAAGMLLDIEGIAWKSDMPTGMTPVTKLLAGKSVSAPVVIPQSLQKFEEHFGKRNQQIDIWRVPFEENLQDANFVRVAIPQDWVQGSYSPIGFYIPASNQDRLYTPFAIDHKFYSQKGGKIDVKKMTPAYYDKVDTCESTMWYIVVPKSDITQSAGVFHAANAEVNLDVGGAYKTGADGFTYLCTAPLSSSHNLTHDSVIHPIMGQRFGLRCSSDRQGRD